MKPAFDTLRQDRASKLSKEEFVTICPEVDKEIVEILYDIFDTNPRDGNIHYGEMCTFMLLAGDSDHVEQQLESLFLVCDIDGDDLISVKEFRQIISLLYYSRFKDMDFCKFKRDKVLEEAMADTDGETLTLEQFTDWARSDKVLVSEVRTLLQDPIVKEETDEGPLETWTVQAQRHVERIKVENPVVEIDGDEMTRIMWQMIKETLIFPYLDMDIDYYDLSITYRDETADQVTKDAVRAIQKHNVGIKCATIIPDQSRVLEFNLSKMWEPSSEKLLGMLRGITFQQAITVPNIPKIVPGWEKPIVVCRHGPVADGAPLQLTTESTGTLKVTVEAEGGDPEELLSHTLPSSGGGVVMGVYSSREAIDGYAKCCFEHALSQKLPLYLSTRRAVSKEDANKKAVLKEIDALYVESFSGIYQSYKKQLEEKGLGFHVLPIQEMMAKAINGSGGYVWACTDYGGETVLGLVMQGTAIPGLSISTHVCKDGKVVLTEAAHGTATKHYRAFQAGEPTHTNPMASILSWARGLAHRANLDGNTRLADFSQALEEACTAVIQKGMMSKDLALLTHGKDSLPETWTTTEDLVSAVSEEVKLIRSKPRRPKPSSSEGST